MKLLSEFKKESSLKTHANNALGAAGTAMTIGGLASSYKPGSKLSNALSDNPTLGKIGLAAAGAYGAKQAFKKFKNRKRKKKFSI